MFFIQHSVFFIHHSLFHFLLFTVHFSAITCQPSAIKKFKVHFLPFTFLLFTIYFSPLTSHLSPLSPLGRCPQDRGASSFSILNPTLSGASHADKSAVVASLVNLSASPDLTALKSEYWILDICSSRLENISESGKFRGIEERVQSNSIKIIFLMRIKIFCSVNFLRPKQKKKGESYGRSLKMIYKPLTQNQS